MEKLQTSSGYSGRSELIRTSLRLLLDDNKKKASLKGQINAVLVITHDKGDDQSITRVKHEFEDIVKTHVHNQISQDSCVELLLLQGDGKRVRRIAESLQREDKLRSVRLVLT